MSLLGITAVLTAFWLGVGFQEIHAMEANNWTKPVGGAMIIATAGFGLFLLLRGIFA